MVLANRLIALVWATLPLLAYSQVTPPDIATINGIKLTLTSSRGTCELAVAGIPTKIKLDLAGPCLFLRRHENEIEHYRYKKIGTTILIAGAPATADYLVKYNTPGGQTHLNLSDKCSDQGQAIILNGKTVSLTQTINNELFCPYIGRDEKDYYHFAHYLRKPDKVAN